MRAVYLVRHGQPEMPGERRLCVGRTDLPLSRTGAEQARRLGEYFAGLPATVISSPLKRCRDTAAAISEDYELCEGLLELDMGQWTGLSFEEIRARWPQLYEKRGREPDTVSPPEGESLQSCAQRVTAAFREIFDGSEGTLILCAHSGVIRSLCAALTGRDTVSELDPPRCGSVTQLLLDGDDVCPGPYGALPEELPAPVPDAEACVKLLRRLETPQRVIAHCRAVAELALEICGVLGRCGEALNTGLVYAGALLHDMARTRPRHDEYAARWLCREGCAALGAVVGNHMSLGGESAERWSESAVVFLADKLVKDTRRVSLEERFFADPDPRKLPFIQKRYELARDLLRRLEEAEEDGEDI